MIKTFKIGEEAIGGIVQVSTRSRGVYEVKVMDYNTKEPIHWRFVFNQEELEKYLNEITTTYWTDKIINYFTSNKKFKNILKEK